MLQPSVTESRVIDAPATRIFSILSNPALHPELDGTGMLRTAVDDKVISKVGDVFSITMVHWDRGNYVMDNHVVEFEQDRRIAWEPILHSVEMSEYQSDVGVSTHQQWGWQLEPLGEYRTRVTEVFDCSRSPEGLRNYIKDGEFWRLAMVTSLKNLERMVTQS